MIGVELFGDDWGDQDQVDQGEKRGLDREEVPDVPGLESGPADGKLIFRGLRISELRVSRGRRLIPKKSGARGTPPAGRKMSGESKYWQQNRRQGPLLCVRH